MKILHKDIQPGTVVRHLKRGSQYVVTALATMQDSTHDMMDDETVVVYRGADALGVAGTYARMMEEFCDGRFEIVSQP